MSELNNVENSLKTGMKHVTALLLNFIGVTAALQAMKAEEIEDDNDLQSQIDSLKAQLQASLPPDHAEAASAVLDNAAAQPTDSVVATAPEVNPVTVTDVAVTSTTDTVAAVAAISASDASASIPDAPAAEPASAPTDNGSTAPAE